MALAHLAGHSRCRSARPTAQYGWDMGGEFAAFHYSGCETHERGRALRALVPFVLISEVRHSQEAGLCWEGP